MDKKRVLCYGDSNTWGYIAGTACRRKENERWTGVCQNLLGEKYTILEDGLNGRTTIYDDPTCPYRNGLKGLGYALISQKPLDLVVIMLGTNDYKYTDTSGVADGIDEIVRTVLNSDSIYRTSNPIFPNSAKVLLMSPIALPFSSNEDLSLFSRNSVESNKLPKLCEEIAQRRGVFFLNAAEYGKASPVDGIHLDAESHYTLGTAVAKAIQKIFEY